MKFPLFAFLQRSRLTIVGCSALLAVLASACSKAPTITTEAAGHAITAEIEGTPSVESGLNGAVVAGPHGRVTIERERVRLDDLAWTTIPADVPVTVRIKRHEVRISAGGTSIARTTSD